MIYALLIVLGLVFGSFYLVVATRLPKEESLVTSRSHCDNCKHILKWYELIPLISFIIQKGKCRKCGAKISVLAPLIEIVTAFAFAFSYYLYGFSYSFYALVLLLSLLIIIFISDFKYFIISDEPLFITIVATLTLKYIYFGFDPFVNAVISGLVMFGVFMLVKLFGDFTFKKESLGGGDIKLAILIGVTLGIKLGLVAFILSAFIALPYAIVVSLKSKEGIVPFGPFIITSLVTVFIFMDYFSKLIHYLFTF